MEYVIRWTDAGDEIVVERVTAFGAEVIWSTSADVCADTRDGNDLLCEILLYDAKVVACRDAGRALTFEPSTDGLILLRSGDVFDQEAVR